MITNLIAWIVLGAVAGWLASMVMKTNQSQGLIMDIIVGIVGSFIGGFIFSQLFSADVDAFSIGGLIVAVIGASILLAVLRMVRK